MRPYRFLTEALAEVEEGVDFYLTEADFVDFRRLWRPLRRLERRVDFLQRQVVDHEEQVHVAGGCRGGLRLRAEDHGEHDPVRDGRQGPLDLVPDPHCLHDETAQILEQYELSGGFGVLLQMGFDYSDPGAREGWMRSMELLATEVMPRVNASITERAP